MFIEYAFFLFKLILIYYLILFPLKLFRRLYNSKSKSIMIVLGSGGHTAEILTMLKKLDFNKFSKIFFVHPHNDVNSVKKLQEQFNLQIFQDKIQILSLYRSRQVGQSYFSSIFTTLIAFAHSILLVLKTQPNLVSSN
jgi:beta-1,4-N-acetylglucosaminyltransferase